MKGTKKVWRDGKWHDGAATPWLPPENLRGLPSEWVTKDTSDPDKIHELDDPHIVSALVEEQAKALLPKKEEPESIIRKYDLWGGPFDQLHIDLIKFKAIRNLVRTAQVWAEHGDKFPLKRARHLWFPEPKLGNRELRDGRSPLPRDRPQHLRDKDLIVDVYEWPPRIVDMLKEKGIDTPDVAALEALFEEQSRLVQVVYQ